MSELPAVDGHTPARILGVTPKEIYDLAKGGVLVRSARRLFDSEVSVRRYCEWLRGQIVTEQVAE